jgi:hypothetical protein
MRGRRGSRQLRARGSAFFRRKGGGIPLFSARENGNIYILDYCKHFEGQKEPKSKKKPETKKNIQN